MTIDNWFQKFLGTGKHSIPEWDETQLWASDIEAYKRKHPKWFPPYVPDLIHHNQESYSNDPMRVIVEPATLNMALINGVAIPQTKKFEFRPQTWEQFIGQTQAKQRVSTITAQLKRGMRAHIIMSALKGHGKTSYIELLAKTLDANLIQRMGNAVTIDVIPELINEINKSEKLSLLFIDEIDAMDKTMIKMFNSIVESFQISGKHIKPFLFACATINKNVLVKNNPDFLDRLQHHINFTRYSIEELTQIITQVYQNLYKEENISKEQLTQLALNCKYNPRTAINLLEFFIVDQNVSHVLQTCGIIKDGLTFIDVKILQFLASQSKPVGSNVIAMKASMSQREYETEWEGFLFEFGYINRLPSRMITEKGKEFLKSISNQEVVK